MTGPAVQPPSGDLYDEYLTRKRAAPTTPVTQSVPAGDLYDQYLAKQKGAPQPPGFLARLGDVGKRIASGLKEDALNVGQAFTNPAQSLPALKRIATSESGTIAPLAKGIGNNVRDAALLTTSGGVQQIVNEEAAAGRGKKGVLARIAGAAAIASGPFVGAMSLPAEMAANAGIGAAMTPDDPLVGAAAGAMIPGGARVAGKLLRGATNVANPLRNLDLNGVSSDIAERVQTQNLPSIPGAKTPTFPPEVAPELYNNALDKIADATPTAAQLAKQPKTLLNIGRRPNEVLPPTNNVVSVGEAAADAEATRVNAQIDEGRTVPYSTKAPGIGRRTAEQQAAIDTYQAASAAEANGARAAATTADASESVVPPNSARRATAERFPEGYSAVSSDVQPVASATPAGKVFSKTRADDATVLRENARSPRDPAAFPEGYSHDGSVPRTPIARGEDSKILQAQQAVSQAETKIQQHLDPATALDAMMSPETRVQWKTELDQAKQAKQLAEARLQEATAAQNIEGANAPPKPLKRKDVTAKQSVVPRPPLSQDGPAPTAVRNADGSITERAFHGTAGDHSEFDSTYNGSVSSGVSDGFWFSKNRRYAGEYAENASGIRGKPARIIEADLRYKNPLTVHFDGNGRPVVNGEIMPFEDNADVVKYAKEQGHDSIDWANGSFTDDPSTTVFHPHQIEIVPEPSVKLPDNELRVRDTSPEPLAENADRNSSVSRETLGGKTDEAPSPMTPAKEVTMNWRTWGEPGNEGEKTTLARVKALADSQSERLKQEKGYVSFQDQKSEAAAALRDLIEDPKNLDRSKLKNLTGAEIVAVKEIVQSNERTLEAVSRDIVSGNLTEEEMTHALKTVDQLEHSSNEAMATIVGEQAKLGRGLGYLRNTAAQSQDPAVWLVKAQKVYGADRVLPDSVKAQIRAMAKEIKTVCDL